MFLVLGVGHLAVGRITDDLHIDSIQCINECAEQLTGAIYSGQQDQLHRHFRLRVHSHHEARTVSKHWLALAVLLAGAVHATVDPVTLTFDWPRNLACRVEQFESQGDGKEARRTFLLRTSAVADGGMMIEASNPRVHLSEPAARRQSAAEARIFLASRLPPFIIGPAGTLVGLQDHENAIAELRDALSDHEAILAPMNRGEIEDTVRQLAGQDRLLTNISELWNPAVEDWLDFHYESKPVVDEGTLEIEGSPVPLKIKVTLDLAVKPPCLRAGRERACVELTRNESTDPESLKQVMAAMIARTDKKKSTEIHALGMDNRVVTLTERDTLVPHQVTTIRTLKFGPADGAEPMEMIQRQSWRFECHEAASP
jgi:hypothetical protein